MKLYIFKDVQQAQNALNDFRGQKVSYITSAMTFKGVLRKAKDGTNYIKRKAERVDIVLADVAMIVDNNEIRIITNI